jgi:hypothetical protein
MNFGMAVYFATCALKYARLKAACGLDAWPAALAAVTKPEDMIAMHTMTLTITQEATCFVFTALLFPVNFALPAAQIAGCTTLNLAYTPYRRGITKQ